MVDQAALEPVFQALAHPLRRELLARLAREEATVGQLAAPCSVSLNAVSKHLKVLESAGLISRRWVATEARLRAVPSALQPAREWLSDLERFWGTQLDALEAHLEQTSPAPEEPQPKASKARPTTG